MLGPVLEETITTTDNDRIAQFAFSHNDAARREAERLDLGSPAGSSAGGRKQIYTFTRGAVVITWREIEDPAVVLARLEAESAEIAQLAAEREAEREAESAAAAAPAGTVRIGLVGCGSAKLGRPAPARDLYTSQLFRKASAYAAATCDRWYVLSAKHGLVRPDQILEPYDVKLGANLPSSPPIHAWAAMVREQLAVELADVAGAVLVALAGEQYRTVLRPCAWPFEIPMQGLGIGQQLGFLTRELQQLEAAA
jgi:hypothetical protein